MPTAIEARTKFQRLLKQIKLCTGQEEMPECRRASFRLVWSAPAEIKPLNPNGFPSPLYARTRTISAHGLGFISPRELQLGQRVVITLEANEGEVQIPAMVVRLTPSVGMPTVGVTFDLD